MKKIITLLLLITLVSCTENQRARTFGGKEEVKLPVNHKLINVTWKETNLWVLSQDTITGELSFKENSSFGIIEGEVIFKSNPPLPVKKIGDTSLAKDTFNYVN